MNNIKIILILLFILVLVCLRCKERETFVGARVPNDIMRHFNKDTFLRNIGDYRIIYLKYKGNSLDAHDYIHSTINEFLKIADNKNNSRYQIKQDFNGNKLSKYFLKWGYNPLVKILGLKGCSPNVIRISKSKWSFDYHYDCNNLLLVQLIGSRTVYLRHGKHGKPTKHIINAGDILYIPIGVYHRVESGKGLNVNFNIELNDISDEEFNKCNQNFNKDFKIQSYKCETNNCI